MKKVILVLAALLLAVPSFAAMDARFMIGDGTSSKLLFDVTKEIKATVGLNYLELHGKVGSYSASGSAIMPSIGGEYSFNVTKNVEALVGIEYQHIFPTFKVEGNPMLDNVNSMVNDVLDKTVVNCISVYTGVNVKITPVLSLTGTTGIRLLNGSYSKDGVDLNLGMNSIYTQVGMLVSL